MEARMEKQAEYVVVIPGVTGPTHNITIDNTHWSFLPIVHGEVEAVPVSRRDVVGGRVLGVDVSHWQAKRGVVPVRHMDWGKCKQTGAQFAFIRAGSITKISGELYEDFEFQYNSEAAPGLMPVGYYWYWRPNFSVTGQANYFCGLIDSKDRRLPPVVDVETTGGFGASAIAIRLAIFCENVWDNIGEWPMIYTRGSFWNPTASGPGVGDHVLWASLDLWVARYVNLPEPWGNPGDSPVVRPRHWNDWLFWQFSADGNGRGAEFGAQSASIDLDYYNGSQDDFDDEFGDGGGMLLEEERVAKLEVDLELLKTEARRHGWEV